MRSVVPQPPIARIGAAGRRSLAGAWCPALVVVVQALLTWRTVGQVRQGLGARNLEATYHSILTAKALVRTPWDQHWGLPTVSFGRANDKWIAWGAAVPTDGGDLIYTSFPPAGFWLPALAALLRGGEVGHAGLVVLNGVLASASAVLLYVLVVRAVRRLDRAVGPARAAGLAAALLYVFSAESLQSHGAVYWPHALLQPLLLVLLLILERLLLQPEGPARARLLTALGLVLAVACYTEWSAYVFALLSGAMILVVPWLRQRIAAAGLVLLGVAVATGAVLALHFMLAIGPDAAVDAWQSRFAARTGDAATLVDLQEGYARSFAATIGAALALTTLAALRPAVCRRSDPVAVVLVVFAATAVMENLLLRQHATQFSFDRLKLAIPLTLVAGLAMGYLTRRRAVLAGAVVAAAAASGVAAGQAEAMRYADWTSVDATNRALVSQAGSQVDLRCATIGTNTKVRGYTNLVFDRGVHEFSSPTTLRAVARGEPSCGVVYVEARMAQTDLPQFLSIVVDRPDGRRVVLAPR